MVKTSMTGTIDGSFRHRKRKVQPLNERQAIAKISVVRDANNPVKRRAEARARAIGKTLPQVYQEAGVNKAYLTDVPKNGWQDNKIRAIAASLEWDARDLLYGPTSTGRSPEQEKPELLEVSIDLAAHLLAHPKHGERVSPKIGELSLLLYESLLELCHDDEPLPSDRMLRIWVSSLLAAWRAASKR
jgi:hypothetical protein